MSHFDELFNKREVHVTICMIITSSLHRVLRSHGELSSDKPRLLLCCLRVHGMTCTTSPATPTPPHPKPETSPNPNPNPNHNGPMEPIRFLELRNVRAYALLLRVPIKLLTARQTRNRHVYIYIYINIRIIGRRFARSIDSHAKSQNEPKPKLTNHGY
jgi:hypothetical protein